MHTHADVSSDLTFWEHIGVLRTYVLWSAGVFFAAAVSIFAYGSDVITSFLLNPLHGAELVFLSPLGPFLFEIRIALMGAFVVTFPLWLFLFVHFVGDAIPKRKRFSLILFIMAACLLGVASIAGAYLYLIPVSLAALSNFVVPGTSYMLTAESYVSFALLSMTVSFFVLELPLAIIMFSYLGLLDPAILRRHRGGLYIGLTILLALLTPTTDVVTLLIVCIPTVLLTEGGLLVAQFVYTWGNNQTI